ncbi:MAG: hypothetical protein RL490_2630 [Pseudomonadota bacterium]
MTDFLPLRGEATRAQRGGWGSARAGTEETPTRAGCAISRLPPEGEEMI